jgi:hypothetical protein
MDIMKRRFILLSLILSAVALIPASASVTVEQSTDPEYLINSGYSQMAAEDTFILKNRANGKPIEPLYDRNDNNFFVKSWKTFWGYVDPAHEQADKLHHNIKPSPSFTDL